MVETDRREFLVIAGGILLAQAPSIPWNKSLAQGSGNERILVGVITEPTAAMNFRLLASSEALSGILLADESGKSFALEGPLASARSPVKTFKDYRDMLRESPQLVIVSLEAHKAPQAIAAALEAGCHVLSEKPPCTQLDQFELLCQLADKKQRQLMLGMPTRLHPAAVKAKEIIDAGNLGQLFSVTMNSVTEGSRLFSPAYQQSWVANKAKAGGGKLLYHGFHYIDLMHFLADDVVARVCGFTETVSGQPIGVEDCAALALKFRKGMVGTLNTGFYLNASYDTSIQIWGSEGWLRIELPSEAPLQWQSTKFPAAGVQRIKMESEPDDYGLMVCNAIDACRGAAKPFMQTSDSLNVMRVVFGAYEFASKDLAGKGA